MESTNRCGWARTDIEVVYHDQEWGVPLHDDQRLFEFLVLEGAQAGLSWVTILKKREAYRKAFDQFEIAKVARYRPARIEKLLGNAGIVRNRLKVESAVSNARCTLEVQQEFGSLHAYLWQFVDGSPIRNAWKSWKQIPATSPQSDAMSKQMRKRGFRFVGSTICYAFMQAVGMVNDHAVDCYRYNQIVNQTSRRG
jgi:DNA-3-methyladenine glycosylase I